jgi:hypothetical protein
MDREVARESVGLPLACEMSELTYDQQVVATARNPPRLTEEEVGNRAGRNVLIDG